jgi:hypothetical protein
MTTPKKCSSGVVNNIKVSWRQHGGNVVTIVKTATEFLLDIVGKEHEIVK